MRRVLAVALLVIHGSHDAVNADGWPEFRGPTGQGLVKAGRLPTTWGPDKNQVWKQAVPGVGWSSPVIHDNRVYLTTSVEDQDTHDQSLRAICLDAADGRILWNREIFHEDGKQSPRIHTKNSHASPTPIVHDGRLYVHFGHMGTASLDLNGQVLWKNTDNEYNPIHGNGGSPVVVESALVFSCDGGDEAFVVALDCRTGRRLWKTDRNVEVLKSFSFCTPLVIEVKGQKQIISPGSGVVCAYEPRTGKEIWRVRHGGYSVVPRPVSGHGFVYICAGYDKPELFAIRPDGSGDVTETHVAWKLQKTVPLTPSLLLVGSELYMISDRGVASCVDARTGQEHWLQRLPGQYSASPLYCNGLIYVENEEGTGSVFRAAKTYEEVARNELNERTLASFAAAGNALFVRTERHLYRFEQR